MGNIYQNSNTLTIFDRCQKVKKIFFFLIKNRRYLLTLWDSDGTVTLAHARPDELLNERT